jgi:Osmosensitive K+ channel histidine kinase
VSRNTLRIVIILAAFSIAGITATQIYWVRKAFDLRENQFNRDVNTALADVANRIFEINKTPSPANNPVTQLSTNYFVVLVNGPIDSNLLDFLISTEFEKRNILADYEYGIYNCVDQCMVGGNYVSPNKSKTKKTVSLAQLPTWKNDGYYFGVQFPAIQANLISQMGIWSFSSVVLLVVICFFSYTLFVILKQKRLSEIQKDFINNMTHEFKTPLSTIAISTEVLKDPNIIQTPERLLNYATIIETENHRLRQQVERVLQMAKLEKDEIGLKKEVVDIHKIIEDAVANNSLMLKNKGGKVESALTATSTEVKADKLHMTNIIFNLLDNAIKYCQKDPLIQIRTSNQDQKLVIEVQDNGIGIAHDQLKKIFHQFYRVSTGNLHDVKGFGLGLHYVKLMVNAHQGKVTAESAPGQGSIFKITLPLS